MGLRGWVLVSTWLGLVVAGFASLNAYRYQPGDNSLPASERTLQEPSISDDSSPSSRPELLVFLDSRCPCSQATLSNLMTLVNDCSYPVRIVFVGEENLEGPGVKQAAAVTRSILAHDSDGSLARRWGARTSGQVYLGYSPTELWFCGGVTDGRGHAGENPGLAALRQRLRGETTIPLQMPVFGCPLTLPEPRP